MLVSDVKPGIVLHFQKSLWFLVECTSYQMVAWIIFDSRYRQTDDIEILTG